MGATVYQVLFRVHLSMLASILFVQLLLIPQTLLGETPLQNPTSSSSSLEIWSENATQLQAQAANEESTPNSRAEQQSPLRNSEDTPNTQYPDQNQTEPARSLIPLPDGFAGIALGMPYDEVEQLLQRNAIIFMETPPEIYRIPPGIQKVMRIYGHTDEGTGYQFIREGYFQFNEEDILISISLYFNLNLLDYFTLYQVHEQKYGEAGSITPNKTVWENESIQLILEKPLTLKYVLKDYLLGTDLANTEARSIAERKRSFREAFLSLF